MQSSSCRPLTVHARVSAIAFTSFLGQDDVAEAARDIFQITFRFLSICAKL